MGLKRLIYLSSATGELEPDQLNNILESSRRNNTAAGITGMLLYDVGNFLQVMEGPQAAVSKTLERIKKDQRHSGIIKVIEEEIETRHFGEWAMGFKRFAPTEAQAQIGFSKLLEEPPTAAEREAYPASVRAFVDTFLR